MLNLVGDVMGLLDLDEFRNGVLAALHEALPSKYVSLNEMALDRVLAVLVDPPLEDRLVQVFGELGHENPLYRHHVATGDGRAYRFSDVAPRSELEATRLFRE